MPNRVQYGTGNPMYIFSEEEVLELFREALKKQGVHEPFSAMQVKIHDYSMDKDQLFSAVPQITVMVSNRIEVKAD